MKKHLLKFAAAAAVLAMLIPARFALDDGGTREYSALLYRITKRHSMIWSGEMFGYEIGTEVRILGIKVYDDVKFIPAPRQ